MDKVLIFGVGGFVGRYLVQEFIKNGYQVAGSDKVNSNILPENVKFIKADLLDADVVSKLVASEQPDMIVNLAAISSVGASWSIPQATISVNVIGALNIMEAARKCEPMPKVMFIGSSGEYEESNPPSSENTP